MVRSQNISSNPLRKHYSFSKYLRDNNSKKPTGPASLTSVESYARNGVVLESTETIVIKVICFKVHQFWKEILDFDSGLNNL